MDIFYFRGPDRQAPFEKQCRLVGMLGSNGIGALHGVMSKWRMNLHFRGVVFYQVCLPSDTAISPRYFQRRWVFCAPDVINRTSPSGSKSTVPVQSHKALQMTLH